MKSLGLSPRLGEHEAGWTPRVIFVDVEFVQAVAGALAVSTGAVAATGAASAADDLR